MLVLTAFFAGGLQADERLERFDKDPGWDSHNNRAVKQEPRVIKQDFGYSATAHVGGEVGELGGFITPAAEAAYYAKKLKPLTFDDSFEASGKLMCKGRQFHVLLGLFNADTVNDWRTPNTIAIRLMGRGDRFFAFVEYATSRWRAGGDSPGGFALVKEADTGRMQMRGFERVVVHRWSLRYDPKGNKGAGEITVTLGGETSICHLDEGHKADGATFNRFGLLNVMKSADDPGELFLDDININGQAENFARDPQWEGRNNRATYKTTNIRPRFDFGFSPTQHAGGQGAGELGGLVFRGDCRYPDKLAYYGDRIGPLTMEQPLKASGKICLRRGVSDSTTLLGFFHAKDSMTVNPSQASGLPKSFLGIAIEGPSSQGFFVLSPLPHGCRCSGPCRQC